MKGRRHDRIRRIAGKLCAAGLDGADLTRPALEAASPTRMHVAQALCGAGIVADPEAAFDRWLGQGRPAYAAAQWDSLADVVRCVVAAGGVPVLAHPHRYKTSNGQLRELVGEFKQAG